jgi:uncharacterized protein YecT (DUF1311 family)
MRGDCWRVEMKLLIGIIGALLLAPALNAQTQKQVEARYTKAYSECMNSDEGMSTYGMLDCISKEVAIQEPQLNAVYAAKMAELPAKRKIALRKLERQWIKDRNARCNEAAAEYEGGTAAPVAYNSCYLSETVKRTIWLERYR